MIARVLILYFRPFNDTRTLLIWVNPDLHTHTHTHYVLLTNASPRHKSQYRIEQNPPCVRLHLTN